MAPPQQLRKMVGAPVVRSGSPQTNCKEREPAGPMAEVHTVVAEVAEEDGWPLRRMGRVSPGPWRLRVEREPSPVARALYSPSCQIPPWALFYSTTWGGWERQATWL